MDMSIINEWLALYAPQSKQDELNAFKEIAQEMALRALARANFFKQGAFQGGTCLRIIYGLPRFSEDLDFILYQPQQNFRWQPYLDEICGEFAAYGLSVEVSDRSEVAGAVKLAFIKENSFGKVLNLQYRRDRADTQNATIKLEIDTNPPMGSSYENKILDFPTPFSLAVQTLPCLFSGKIHALLCREYVKGRDWYDFVWYISRHTPANLGLLKNALEQLGSWQGQTLTIDRAWLVQRLLEKIRTIDWAKAQQDILPFIKPRDIDSIALWNAEFFEHYVSKIECQS